MLLAILATLTVAAADAPPSAPTPYLQAVRIFADNVLEYGRDVYGPRHTPLLIDGLNVDTHEPAKWILPEDCARVWQMPRESIMSNLASQQNLFRVLDALTMITGDPRYRQVAVDAIRHAFDHFQYKDGLLFWGGHAMIDLQTEEIVGESHKDWSRGVPIPAYWSARVIHELKHHFPYYELMWQVDPKATQRLIEGFWGAHILNWANLDMNRHGVYGRSVATGWDSEYAGGIVPFYGKGLSIMHGGSDLIYAAGMLNLFTGDARSLTWATRMTQRYADVRHPTTGLGPDAYNYYHNERVLAQFGPEYGNRITEMTIASIYNSRYSEGALSLLKLAQRLGPTGEPFRRLAVEDLTAFARYAYDPQDNSFWVMLTDGTKLTADMVHRPGVIDPAYLGKHRVGGTHLWAYVAAFAASNDPQMWSMARRIAAALDLGDIGHNASGTALPNFRTNATDAHVLWAVLDLHGMTGNADYLKLARRIGDNVLSARFHRGFFVPSANHLFAAFDDPTALALLYLDARIRGSTIQLPFYAGGESFFHCDYEGHGRTYAGSVIYNRLRAATTQPSTSSPPAGQAHTDEVSAP